MMNNPPSTAMAPPPSRHDQLVSSMPLSPRGFPDTQEDMPACQSCRKRKLKCSRQLPTCSQCSRLSCHCVYDQKKQKPGLRSGMVEHLNRRLEVLEKTLFDERRRARQPPPAPRTDDAKGCAYHAALLIANEILKDGPLQSCGEGSVVLGKRKRPSNASPAALEASMPDGDANSALPPRELLDMVIDCYFDKIHFWIPMIHQGRFRARYADPKEQPKLVILIHAMVAIAAKHIEDHDNGDIERYAKVSRNIVMLNAMESLSVENLQALALLAFEYTGAGNFPAAWSIVGSLTKSVDYLQLAIEPDEQPRQSLLDPPKLLPDATGPIEVEERRRVFWNIILLDRFCSATSGWNSSLNSYNVRRRLPSNGGLWAAGEPVVTPYLGILDKSTAKPGNFMSYVAEPTSSSDEQDSQPSPPNAAKSMETSNVGAFAFRIEAAESLNQVISFFLQQEIDFRNRDEVSRWLARFKELDLRLVQWKLFFPQRWSSSKVSKERPRHIMDPNLTVAHLTHNASTILLHQHIATPPPDVAKHVKLPSSCSAETCQLAAVEIAGIVERYLGSADHPVPSQFAFCAFIAARTLLVRWRFDGGVLSADFDRIVGFLQEMSRRWQGGRSCGTRNDVAARYASELQTLHSKCLTEPAFRIELLNYPYLTAASATAQTSAHDSTSSNDDSDNADGESQADADAENEPNHVQYTARATPAIIPETSTGLTPAGLPFHLPLDMENNEAQSSPTHSSDELAAMSQVFWDQTFLEMDRVFTLDGTDFSFQ